jgi:hypothetical protein
MEPITAGYRGWGVRLAVSGAQQCDGGVTSGAGDRWAVGGAGGGGGEGHQQRGNMS